MRRSRRRIFASATLVVALAALLAFFFAPAQREPEDSRSVAPAPRPQRARLIAEKPRGEKRLVRTYLRQPDSDAAPIVVEEFREETLAEKRDPIRLYASAKVMPLYDNEQLLGITISRIEPNSFWEMVGFVNGDFVLDANGERMDNPNTSVAFMNSLHAAPEVLVRVRGVDGDERTLLYNAPRE